jgi:hypothetical protein
MVGSPVSAAIRDPDRVVIGDPTPLRLTAFA